MNEQTLLESIIAEIEERKAENIVAYKVSEVSSMNDYVVIATATSQPHVSSMAEYLVDEMKGKKVKPFAVEGQGNSRWVCLDFGEVMVHLMCEQEREYYNLEAIWGACPRAN